jgi:hypothetical protein
LDSSLDPFRTAGARIVDVKHDVRAEIWLGPIAQHSRLNLVEINGDGTMRNISAEAICQ